ncbi:hypothetical protein WJU23_22295 [Prosthecobacter sp. SYSU 5D2]|uniref:hypothetical protein n=1 Tax=Prosthecobacter sp. SYSU 5D2 TaxID=3134134 RepID=UPI0031FF177E
MQLGHANGFKPKTLATRMGQVELRIPQVRHGGLLVDCAVLIAIGMDGKRTILGVSDAHPGIGGTSGRLPRRALVPRRVRDQLHLQQSAQAYVPRLEMRSSAHGSGHAPWCPGL